MSNNVHPGFDEDYFSFFFFLLFTLYRICYKVFDSLKLRITLKDCYHFSRVCHIEGSLLLSGTATRSKVSSNEAVYLSLLHASWKIHSARPCLAGKLFFDEGLVACTWGRSFCSSIEEIRSRQGRLASPVIKRLIGRPQLRLDRQVGRWIMHSFVFFLLFDPFTLTLSFSNSKLSCRWIPRVIKISTLAVTRYF